MITTKSIYIRNNKFDIQIDGCVTDANVQNGHLVVLNFAQGVSYSECAKRAIRVAYTTSTNVSYLFSNVWIAFSPSAITYEQLEITEKYEYFNSVSKPLNTLLESIDFYNKKHTWSKNSKEEPSDFFHHIADAIIQLRKQRKGITTKSLDSQLELQQTIRTLRSQSGVKIETFIAINDVCNMVERLIEYGYGTPQVVINDYFSTALLVAKILNENANTDDVIDYVIENWRYGELVKT